MTPHKRPRFGPGEIFLLIVIGLIALIVVTAFFVLLTIVAAFRFRLARVHGA